MREASCGSLIPAIIIYDLFIINYLLLVNTYSGSMRQASCGSMMPTIIFNYYLLFIYLLIINYWLPASGNGGGADVWGRGPFGVAHGGPQGPPSGAESCVTFVSHCRTAAHCRTARQPHNTIRTASHCSTHYRTPRRALLPYTDACTTSHCRSHTVAYCRTTAHCRIPHCRTLLHCRSLSGG
jgi:hypothetical protein